VPSLVFDEASAPNYIITLGVGGLALLILETGQCESLTTGMGAEEQTPTSFFVSILVRLINAEFGSIGGNQI